MMAADGGVAAHSDEEQMTKRSRYEREQRAAAFADLTPQELAVLALVAEGLTNPQIAGRLVISVRTVKKHVEQARRRGWIVVP